MPRLRISVLIDGRILGKKDEDDEDEDEDEEDEDEESEEDDEEEETSPSQGRNGFTAEQNACQKEALQLHNSLRARHGVAALVLDDSISRKAQAYAEYLADSGRFEHSSNRDGLGENLYSAWSSVATQRTGFGKCLSMPSLY